MANIGKIIGGNHTRPSAICAFLASVLITIRNSHTPHRTMALWKTLSAVLDRMHGVIDVMATERTAKG